MELNITLLAAFVALFALCIPFFFSGSSVVSQSQADDSKSFPPAVWYAPFLSGGGYCREATWIVSSLRELTQVRIEHHGDSYNEKYFSGLDIDTSSMIHSLSNTRVNWSDAVVICHSEPGAWNLPQSRWPTNPCPPHRKVKYRVGRTMFETDRLPKGWEDRLNQMDQVWVPSQFSYDVFVKGGVIEDKLRILPEPVDTHRFHPEGPKFSLPDKEEDHFIFLSIFKFEDRKGWQFLIRAFVSEFSKIDKVSIYILTNAYHTDSEFFKRMLTLVETEFGQSEIDFFLERFRILPERIPDTEMPSLYRAADSFVLSTRGEGWGLPIVEAMSSGLPVVATLWSGTTEYMTEQNSFPVQVEALDEIQSGAFRGHRWARPSIDSLRKQMRAVFTSGGKSEGVQARLLMETKYSISAFQKYLEERFQEFL